MKAVFTPLEIGLMKMFRSRFKQYKNSMLVSQINVLGCFFLKKVVKFGEIRNS